jgi:hypothetical protein
MGLVRPHSLDCRAAKELRDVVRVGQDADLQSGGAPAARSDNRAASAMGNLQRVSYVGSRNAPL